MVDVMKRTMNTCAICGSTSELAACGDGFVCQPCASRVRDGKDATTRKAKMVQRALRAKGDNALTLAKGGTVSDAESFAAESAALLALDDAPVAATLAHGEVLPAAGELRDTMATPGLVACDASAARLDLLNLLGADCAALAIDAADTINPTNSLERMASHQMALLHHVAMTYAHKAVMHPDTPTQVKCMNVSIRAIETFQRGMLALKRLRSSAVQRIVIERVNVEAGGQAIVGHVESKGTL